MDKAIEYLKTKGGRAIGTDGPWLVEARRDQDWEGLTVELRKWK
jgi:hypothetical protein